MTGTGCSCCGGAGFVQDRWGWELPGGLIDEGEEPAETAKRKLEGELPDAAPLAGEEAHAPGGFKCIRN